MSKQEPSRTGRRAVWMMVLSCLSCLILTVLAVLLMLCTTFGSAKYMQNCVKKSRYGAIACIDMLEDFTSYGAAAGFDADTMTDFLSADQVESDMIDAVAGMYADTLTYYTRSNVAETVYSAMEQAAAERGITLEGETKTAVETVAEAVRLEYASYTAVPLVSQLRTLTRKLQKVAVVGAVICAALLVAAGVAVTRVCRRSPRLGGRSFVYAFGGAALACLVLGLAVEPMLGLQRLSIEPLALKKLLLAYIGGMFNRILLIGIVYLVIAAAIEIGASLRRKQRLRRAAEQE